MVYKIFGIVAFLSTGLAYGMVLEVQENAEVTLQCDFKVQYPAWTGPDGLPSPLTVGQTIQEPGIEWVDNKDLKISKVMLKHDGNYTCSDGKGNSKSVELDVQYFSAWTEYTTATPENTKTVMTCMWHSNPRCKKAVEIVSRTRPGQKIGTNTTIHRCGADPSHENRTKCMVTIETYVSKEDNGLIGHNCALECENSALLTLSPKVKFLFPPTSVNITVEKEESKLNLTCSVDSSNPVSLLKWYRGTNSTASSNEEIASSYQSYVKDAEYNGQNITQSIDITRGGIQEDEKVFCCAGHRNQQYCDSFAIDSYKKQMKSTQQEKTTSGGAIVTVWMIVFVVGVAFLTL